MNIFLAVQKLQVSNKFTCKVILFSDYNGTLYIQEDSLQSSMYLFGIRSTLERERPLDQILDKVY